MPVFTGTITAVPFNRQQLYQNAAEQTRDPVQGVGNGDDFAAGYALLMRWIRTDSPNENEWVCTGDGVWTQVGGGGASLPVVDTTSIVSDVGDSTAQMRIDAGLIDTSTVRVLTMANQDIDLTPTTGSFDAAGAAAAVQSNLTTHIGDTANPHATSVSNLGGLGTNVATALGIAVGTSGGPLVQDGVLGTPSSGTLTSCTGLPIVAGTTSTLTATRGGTSQTTYATGDLLYASASNVLSKLAAGTNSHVLTLAGGVPTWAAASGGISIGTSIGSATEGSVLFAGPSGVLAQDNASFFWDDSNNRLGLGTNSPANLLHVSGSTNAANFRVDGGFEIRSNDFALVHQTLSGSNKRNQFIWRDSSSVQVGKFGTDLFNQNIQTVDFIAGTGSVPMMRLADTGYLGIGPLSPTARLHLEEFNAATTSIINLVTLTGNTGAAGTGFGVSQTFSLKSSTTQKRTAATIVSQWNVATDASRVGDLILNAYNVATAREGLRIRGGAAGPELGFNAAPPIAKPTITGSRAGNAALASILTELANYGLITDSTSA